MKTQIRCCTANILQFQYFFLPLSCWESCEAAEMTCLHHLSSENPSIVVINSVPLGIFYQQDPAHGLPMGLIPPSKARRYCQGDAQHGISDRESLACDFQLWEVAESVLDLSAGSWLPKECTDLLHAIAACLAIIEISEAYCSCM
jgi:hypothetical protein